MKTSNGFTILEMLLVVLIIGILSAIAYPQFMQAVWKTRFTKGLLLAKQISAQVQLFQLEQGYWPIASEIADLIPKGFTYDSVHFDDGEGYEDNSAWYTDGQMSLHCADGTGDKQAQGGYPHCRLIGVGFEGKTPNGITLFVNADPFHDNADNEIFKHALVCVAMKPLSDPQYNFAHSLCKSLGGKRIEGRNDSYYL